jgi:hypothetical protein
MGGGNFKCKKCHNTWSLTLGREVIAEQVEHCNRSNCCLKDRNLNFLPRNKDLPVLTEVVPAVEVFEDYYEEEPIQGFISARVIRKKHGR